MGIIVTIIAGLILAGAATAGVVVTSDGGPSGTAPTTSQTNGGGEITSVYDTGQ